MRQVPPTDPLVLSLVRLSTDLQARARTSGFGGISHHLAATNQAVEARDLQRLRKSLEVLSELNSQAHSELRSPRHVSSEMPAGQSLGVFAPTARASAVAPSAPGSVKPPRMVTVGPSESMAPANVSPAGFATMLSDPRGSPQGGAPPPVVAEPKRDKATPDGPKQPAPPPPISVGPAEPHKANVAPPVVQVLGGSQPNLKTLKSAEPPPPSKVGDPPQFAVKSAFGLRAFGAEPGDPPKPAKLSAQAAPARAPSLARSLFGLKSRKASSPRMPVAPPPVVSRDPSGLRPLPQQPQQPQRRSSPPPRAPQPDAAVGQLLGRISHDSDRHRSTRPKPRRAAARPGAHPRAPQSSGSGWILFGAGTIAVGLLLMVGFLVFSRRDRGARESVVSESSAQAPASASAQALTAGEQPSQAKFVAANERFRALVSQVQGRGGKVSPELRAMLDDEVSVVSKALAGNCANAAGGEVCAELQRTYVDQKPLQIKKRERDPNRPMSTWLQGLKMPEIPVEDDPRVKRMFEYYTENPVGRETLQAMLFRCGAYRDMIHANLVKYELSKDLLALVFAESTCAPLAKSPLGAAGLWQFMPSGARAYHLRVKEGVVDERLNPYKATEAGVRYMRDLRAKLGSWELAFAAYNVGPFGLMARLERAGGDVGFWDLVDNELLPEETSNYVPTIQALALILNNLPRLRFATSQMRAPRLTADLDVPPGTRLSLVARASATSTTELKKYNLDILGENVPNVPGGFAVQVPKDVVWQARDTLRELLAQRDDADLCVSPAFDWGRRQFTTEMAKACHRKLDARAAASAEP